MKNFVRTLPVTCLALLFSATLLFSQNAQQPAQDDSATGLKPARPPHAAAKPGGEEAEGDDATARMLWQIRQNGIPTADFKRKLLRERGRRVAAERSSGMNGAPAVSGPAWIPIGPEDADYETNGGFTGNVRDSGRARKILPHPTDPDTLYFLTSGGGLWVTHNFTSSNTTWTPLTDSLPTTTGGSVAFGRTPNVLYLGLGDPFDVINIGGAMVKSTDGGQTWGPVFDLGAALSVRDILVDSSGADDVVLAATNDGLYRSTDSGVTYTQILGGPGQLFQGQVIWSFAQTSAGIILNAQPCTGIGEACGVASNLYVSTDLGATWSLIPNSGGVYSGAGRATLAVGAPGDSIVYAFAENTASTDQRDLYRSIDGGLNWVALNLSTKVATNAAGNTDNPNMDLMHGQSWYNQMILVDPRDAGRNTVYLGGNLSSAKTTDGGNTWTLLSNWLYPFLGAPRFNLPYVHADFHAAALSTAGTPTLLFGNDGGIFFSTDEGVSWSSDKNRGLQTHLLYSISSTPGFPENVIGGFQDNGTRVREGDSLVYNQSLGGDGIAGTWSQGNTNMSATSLPGNSYGVTLTNQIPDLIATWFRFSFTTGGSLFFAPVTIPSPAAAPSGKILYSNTAGRVFWVDLGAAPLAVHLIGQPGGGGIPLTVTFRGSAHGLGVSPVDLLHVGVPATGGHIELTSNGGASWTDIAMNTVVPGFQSNTQSVTYVDNSTIFVTSVTPTSNAVRVVKSTDGGGTWAAATNGLPDVQVERIIVDPSDVTKQTVLAATYAGVYRSTDGGANWAPYGTGLPSVSVRDIYMPPDGSFVRIATYGRGFWELPSLSYVSSALTDDATSCDHDGSLDSGETGHLTITLHNDSSTALNGVTATISSTNPAISFPSGNVVSFPVAGAHSDTSASITVAMSSVAGIQQVDFRVAYTDPSLGLPSPATAIASFRANTDEVPNGSANDNFEANNSAWTLTGVPESVPDTLSWRHVQITPLEHRWSGLDSNANTDHSLVSPVMHVGAGSFSFSYEQRFRFEFAGTQFFDGMVLELSTDGGSTWTDIGSSATPTYNHTLLAADDNVLSGRPAYSGSSSTYPAGFDAVTVNLGTTYSNQDVRIRFRVATDTGGFAPGIEIRTFATSGLANTPFTALVAHSGVCPTTTSISSDKNPSNFGDLVTFGAGVSGGLTVPTGTVTFKDGATTIGSSVLDGGGQAALATSTLLAGSHSITANYGGDSSHAASTSSVLLQSVQQAGTTTTVVSNLNPSVFGQNVTFTANVTAGSGTPTGSVSFFDGATPLGTVPLSGGTASLSTSALAVGSHNITANYSGDANNGGSNSAPLSQAVTQATSTTALASSANPGTYGQTITLTAAITPQSGGSATGSVSFLDGANPVGSAAVSGNSASVIVTLSVGAHSLKAIYSGDTNVGGSTSPVLSETVNMATSSVTLTSSANPAVVGQSVTYTATVNPQFSGVPSGTITFKQGGVTANTQTLVGGVASFTTSYASAGSFSIKANYSGDGNFKSSASTVLKEVVNRYGVTVAVASDVNPSVYGQTVTFTATLTTSGPTLDGQTVTFKTGSTVLGNATISGGVATLSTSALAAGSRTVKASYAGDGAHSPATGSVVQVVNKASTTTALSSSLNPSGVGQPVTFTATISSTTAVPTGTVKFKSGGTVLGTATLSGGVAVLTTNTLSAGSHNITATYTATPNFSTSSASLVQVVQ